ncbi:MAG: hypothetical protein ACKPKF_03680, partial [Microcystis panniformis]
FSGDCSGGFIWGSVPISATPGMRVSTVASMTLSIPVSPISEAIWAIFPLQQRTRPGKAHRWLGR